jgi:hypothetical protein
MKGWNWSTFSLSENSDSSLTDERWDSVPINPRMVLSLILSTVLSGGANAQTAAVAIATAQEQVNGIVDNAGDQAKSVIGVAGVQINEILDHLKQVLGEEINKPLSELTEAAKTELDGALLMVDSLRKTATEFPKCMGNEGEIALAGLKGGVQSVLSSLPLTKTDPIAYTVEAPLSRSPYVVTQRPGEASHIILKGANLWTPDNACSVNATAVPLSKGGETMIVKVLNYDREKADLLLPGGTQEGEWLLKFTAKVPRLGLCVASREQSVAAGFAVALPQRASVTVSVTPVCQGYELYNMTVPGSCTNGGHSKKSCPTNVVFDRPGFLLVSFECIHNNEKHANIACSRNGNGVFVDASAEGASYVGGHGGGHAVWTVILHGRKTMEPQAQAAITKVVSSDLTPGSGASFSIDWKPSATCEISSWQLGASAAFNHGPVVVLAERAAGVSQSVSTSAGGVSATFNAITLRGTVNLADRGCL